MKHLTESIARLGQVVATGLMAGSVTFGGLALAGSLPRPGSPSPTLTGLPQVWETGRVTRVVDGDTYEVLVGGALLRVRLLGVDAPELDQPFGRVAADLAARRLQGQLVRLRRQGTDLYGRTLADLVLPAVAGRPAQAVDSLLVRSGWAWAFDPTHSRRGPQSS